MAPAAAPATAQIYPDYPGGPGFGGYPVPGVPGFPDPSGLAYYYGMGVPPFLGGFPWPGFGPFPGFPGMPGPGALGMPAGPGAVPGSASGTGETNRVRLTMGDNIFFPAEISVPVGTRITWLNNGSNRHTTTSEDRWDSGTVEPGKAWAAVFRVAGTYDYLCTIHPEVMRGRLTVTPS
jgi:plastocyanin